MKNFYIAFSFFFFWFFLKTPRVHAQVSQNFFEEHQPRYEIGVGAIGINIPDYPGSKRNQMRVIPFPWLIYRGDYLKIDDEGSRTSLFSSKYHETSLGFYFNFPVDSKDHATRQGMPDLDFLVGLGPRFMLRMIPEHPSYRFNFFISVGGVYSTDFRKKILCQGIFIKSGFNYWYQWPEKKTTFFSGLNFEFGSVELNRYFYEVRTVDATPERPVYRAKPGLVESSLYGGVGMNVIENLFVFSSVSWRNLELSENKVSPLVETTNNLGFIIGVVWTFFESDEKVLKPENDL